MWTPAKCFVLICTTLLFTFPCVSYGHNDNPPDHNHIPIVVNEDGEPIFGTYQVLVPENRSNYFIGSLKAIDEDEDDTLTYSLDTENMYYSFAPGHKQPYGHLYTINSETGEVRTGSSGLDFEEFEYTYHPTYKLQTVLVKVEDDNGGSVLFGYYVFIEDVNDNAPQFSEDSQTLSINENELSGTTVGTVSASDADAFAGDHTYSIETENVPFTIESSKRSGTIKTTAVLDYEATSSYTLTVKVDDGFGTDTIDVTINITNDTSDDPSNSAPTFTDGTKTTRSIQENAPSGRNIGSPVSATDDDKGDTLEYTLSGTDAASFSINSNTGQLQTSAALDYETKNTYEITVTVSDSNGGSDSITVTIAVTNDTSDDTTPNNPPTFTDGTSTTRSIQENTPSGRNIGSPVSATDGDSGDTLKYTLSGTDAASFSINSATGQLQTSAALDYETKNTYEITVTVSDSNGGSDSITVTITVDDVDEDPPTDPVPVQQVPETEQDDVTNSAPTFTDGTKTTRSIQENAPSGRNIGSPVSATDSDSGDTLEYTLGGTDAGSFSIVRTTGQLQTSAALDYENKKSYEVTITVLDGEGGTDSITVTISVTNDTSDDPTPNNPPTFTDGTKTTRSIQENTTSGRNIGSAISATDKDSGDTLEYTLSGTDSGSFSIVRTTGQLQTSAALDYENKKSYEVTVSVSDSNGGSDSITVTITVDDVDENPPTDPVVDQQVSEPGQDDVTNSAPVFADGPKTTRSIQENTTSGTNIGLPVSATDGDSGDTLEYTLDGTDAGAFSIVSTTGQLQTSVALDYEKKKSYEVTVSVSDGNGGSDSITVTIAVDDVNEDPPTDPVLVQQVPETEQQDDLQQPKPEIDTESEPNYTIIPFDYEREGVGKVVFSELMLAHLGKYPQWIELYNTTDQDIDINGWKIVGRYLDDSNTINILESQVISKSFTIKGKEIGLIVSFAISNSRDRISNGLADKAYALQSSSKNFWNYEGFVLELQDAEGNPIDRIGNLNEENEIVWEIPLVVRDKRISLIRRLKSIRSQEYNLTFGIKEFGWFPAEKVEHLIEERNQYYYGRYTDIGTPGYRTEDGEILPVKLSSFRSQLNKNGQIILSWVTESELDNAGFNILRSQSKQGPFVKVNPKLIQGAGTTGKRSSYTWIDTTAKSDVVYYYRIEDVSFAGFRNQLATVRTRGHVSASKRYITQWGNLKKQN